MQVATMLRKHVLKRLKVILEYKERRNKKTNISVSRVNHK